MFQEKGKYFIFAAGFLSLCGQILLLRQFEAVFGGNEMTIGIFFAVWLIFTAAGAWRGKRQGEIKKINWLLPLQTIILLLTLFIFQSPLISGKLDFNASPSPIIVLQASLVISLFTFLSGLIFTAVITFSGNDAGKIYLGESLGAAAGGFFAALSIGWLSQYQVTALLIAASFIIASKKSPLIIDYLLYAALALALGSIIELNVRSMLNFQGAVVTSADTKYGRVIISRNAEQYSVYQNGALTVSVPDRLTSEEAVHYALLSHPCPSSVLLIGGGFSGALEEILKHRSVEKIDYLEIDNKLVSILRKKLPTSEAKFLSDPRFRIIDRDYRTYLRNPDQRYDVIIQNLPQPLNNSINRGYTEEFFRQCQASLKAGGIFTFSQSSVGDFISPELAEILASARKTAEKVFNVVKIIPANKTWFICSQNEVSTTTDYYVKQLEARGVQTLFVSPYYVYDWLSPERKEYVEHCISSVKDAEINRDFHPLACLSNMVRYFRQYYPASNWFIQLSDRIKLSYFLIIIAFILITVLLISPQSRPSRLIYTAGFFGGFSQMGSQLLVLLGFQSLFGYLYYQQLLLISAFMIGAAGGAYFGGKWRRSDFASRYMAFLKVQTSVVLLPLAIVVVLTIAKLAGGVTVQLVTIIAVLSGWAGGLQYAAATVILPGGEAVKGGQLYACDLAGAAIGAITAGLLIIPAWGFYQTAAILSFAGLMPLGFLVLMKKSYHLSH